MTQHTVSMKWNEATEQWRMNIMEFTVQEQDGEMVKMPRDFYNCFSINYMFPKLDKTRPKRYRITVEPLDD